jgi:hypothetical protein
MNERAQTVPRVSSYGSRLRWVALVAVTALAGLVAWIVFKGDGDEAKTSGRATATAASVAELKALPAKVGHDFYWAGAEKGVTYELTQTSGGNLYVRYLPAGVQINDPRPTFLTIGTYPRRGAYQVLQQFSKKPHAVSRQLPGGGIAVYSRDTPNSVYVAYSGRDLQVELFDPSPGRALRLATSGKLRPLS